MKPCPGSGLPAACIERTGDGFHPRGRGVCKHCWYSITVNPSNEAHRHPFKGIKWMAPPKTESLTKAATDSLASHRNDCPDLGDHG